MTAHIVRHVGGAAGEWECATCGLTFGHSLRLALDHAMVTAGGGS